MMLARAFCARHFFVSRGSSGSAELGNDETTIYPSATNVPVTQKSTLLTEEEMKMWLEHLSTVQANRKRGAPKAAQTRQKRKGSWRAPDCYCGFCGGKYELETDEVQVWVACDKCETWFHADCVNVDLANQPEHFYCTCCSPHA